jgi:hypothetical protein
LGLLLIGLSISSLRATEMKPDPLERAIGGVLTQYFAKYQELGTPPSGHFILPAIEQGRAQIKALPETERARFYWVVLMTINLDASYLSETQRMIFEDCHDSFLRYAEHFLSKNGISPVQAQDKSFSFSSYDTQMSPVGRMRLHYCLMKANFKGH